MTAREAMLPAPTAAQVEVCRGFEALAKLVPIDRWCVIGGMMTEFVLCERGRNMIRPTTDGDIVGNVLAHARVLRSLANGLQAIGYLPVSSGWDGDIGVRFRSATTGTYIDLLAPANAARRRNVTTTAGHRALEARS